MTFSGIKRFIRGVRAQLSLTKFIDMIIRTLYRNKIYHYKHPENISVALCCIVKNENDYLKEYVEHYHSLGFSKIFIYDNNDLPGEHPSDIVGGYDYVEVINVRGRRWVQLSSYNECLRKNRDTYDWIAFFDADEFLILHSHKTIQEFLSQRSFLPYDSVRICWRNFNDNGLLGCEDNYNRLLVSRFLNGEAATGRQSLTKSIIRCQNKMARFINPHYAAHCIKTCNASGIEIHPFNPRCTQDWETATLNHYRKTIIEFIEHKYNRGFACNRTAKTDFAWFFEYSQWTEEKQAIADKYMKGQWSR